MPQPHIASRSKYQNEKMNIHMYAYTCIFQKIGIFKQVYGFEIDLNNTCDCSSERAKLACATARANPSDGRSCGADGGRSHLYDCW